MYVYVKTPLFQTAILPNIRLIWLMLLKNRKFEETGPPSPISIMLITAGHVWYVCVDLQLFSSKEIPLYLIFS